MSALVEGSPAVNSVETNRSNTQEASTAGAKSVDLNATHPLRFAWTLWYDAQLSSGKRPQNWGENMKEVFTFDTVEDFWRMYNNIVLPSQLQQGCSFNLFKKGIEPKWEDPKNSKGGKWTIIVKKNNIDTLWLWTMLACIGEGLEDELEQDHICGCVVNIRKGQDKIVIWTTDADAEVPLLKIGHNLKKALELPENTKIGYSGHYDEKRANKFEV